MKPVNTKLRSINTKFWNDSYIIKLKPLEKLLFIYLLSNDLVCLAGCYEISPQRISFDTGIELIEVEKILTSFEKDEKVFYKDGFIIIKNYLKNQSLNDNMNKNIISTIKQLPENIKETYLNITKPLEGFESLWKLEGKTRNEYKNELEGFESLREIEGEIEGEDKKEVEGEGESEPEKITHSHLTTTPLEILKPNSINKEITLTEIENSLRGNNIKYDKAGLNNIYNRISKPEPPVTPEKALALFHLFCVEYNWKATLKQKEDGMKYIIGMLKIRISDYANKLKEDRYSKNLNEGLYDKSQGYQFKHVQ